MQQHSQNAEKVTHIKGRLPDQANILFSCVPFQIGTALTGNSLLPDWANSFLYEQFLIAWEIYFITIKWPSLNVSIFITNVRDLCNGCYADVMSLILSGSSALWGLCYWIICLCHWWKLEYQAFCGMDLVWRGVHTKIVLCWNFFMIV